MSYAVPHGVALVRALGAGSVFEVALVERGGRRCICKRPRWRMLEEPAALDALARERSLLERVQHPALPELVAAGSDERGPYLLESAVEGGSLRAMVERYAHEGRTIPARLLSAIARAAFASLAELHALAPGGEPLELVHGDIAPDHVWVDAERVRFIDFGQARWRGTAPPDARGTLPFVAPEVARGQAPPDQANDVYALAASFAFVALGRDPCWAEPGPARLVEVAERGIDLAGLEAAALEPRLRTALERALAFDPAARARRADEVLALLRQSG